MYIVTSILFWGILLGLFAIFNKRSFLFKENVSLNSTFKKGIELSIMLVTILVLQLPMGLSNSWNGVNNNHHDQYELLADSFLEGHLYLDYDVDPKLEALSNPYDYQVRKLNDISVHWDSAYFEGHYYVYFGVVPVILLFLPFKLITGMSLPTIIATRFFVIFIVLGIFFLLKMLQRLFFKKLPASLVSLLSVTVSVLSVWYILDAPELYCTAISCGLAFQIWSFYFFIHGVFLQKKNWKVIKDAILGSLCGALVWGSRPTIGLASLAVIPFIIIYVKKFRAGDYEVGGRVEVCGEAACENGDLVSPAASKAAGRGPVTILRNLCIAALPYLLVALALMLYNYLRFHNPFEFGQSYQMTVTDQSAYGNIFKRFNLIDVLNGLVYNFISFKTIKESFPFVGFSGVLFEFPILIAVFAAFSKRASYILKKEGLYGFSLWLFALPIVITVLSVCWTPYLLERYKLDFLLLMGINAFICLASLETTASKKHKNDIRQFIAYLCIITILGAIALFITPYDANFTKNSPEILEKICKCIFFGKKYL